MSIEPDLSAFETLISPGAQLIRLGEGYQFTEGPVWSPRERCLYFSDIPGDVRWRWSAQRGMEVDERPTFKANGLVLDAAGALRGRLGRRLKALAGRHRDARNGRV